jgi:hypothetical protein
MREACNFMDQDQVDLATLKGQCLMLHTRLDDYAKDLIEPRQSYLLVSVSYEKKQETTLLLKSLLDSDKPVESTCTKCVIIILII